MHGKHLQIHTKARTTRMPKKMPNMLNAKNAKTLWKKHENICGSQEGKKKSQNPFWVLKTLNSTLYTGTSKKCRELYV